MSLAGFVGFVLFRIRSMKLIPLLAFSMGSLLSTAAFANDVIHVRADTWMPFNGDPSADMPGYVVELLKEAMKEAGVEVDYSTMPWADALKGAAEGTVDAVIGANSEEAKGLIVPEEPVGRPDTALFVLKSNPVVLDDAKALTRIQIGICEGYSYWPVLDKLISQKPKNIRVFSGETPLKDAMDALMKGEIEAIPENRPVFIWAVKEKGLPPGGFRTAFIYNGDSIFVAFSAKNPHAQKYAATLTKAIRAMRESGRLAALLHKYGLADWQTMAQD